MFSPWLVGNRDSCVADNFVVPTPAAPKKTICAESGATNSGLASPLSSIKSKNKNFKEHIIT